MSPNLYNIISLPFHRKKMPMRHSTKGCNNTLENVKYREMWFYRISSLWEENWLFFFFLSLYADLLLWLQLPFLVFSFWGHTSSLRTMQFSTDAVRYFSLHIVASTLIIVQIQLSVFIVFVFIQSKKKPKKKIIEKRLFHKCNFVFTHI